MADINEQATEQMLLLTRQMAEREGVTEQLKAWDQMLWVQRIPNPRYVGGILRKIIKCIDGFMPQGQVDGSMNYIGVLSKGSSLADGIIDFSDVANVFFYPMYGIVLFSLAALMGWKVFRKKELK